MTDWYRVPIVVAFALTAACAAPAARESGAPLASSEASTRPPGQRKAITIALRGDINALAGDAAENGRNAPPSIFLQEFIDASLTVRDQLDELKPQLARDLPSLSTGSWVVRDDGRMDVTWTLRPDARWHDGSAVRATDVQFSWEVSSDAATLVGKRGVAAGIEGVDVLDDTTFVMHWKFPSASGGELGNRDLAIMPRHVLGDTFLDNKASFHLSPYFTSTESFVGSGAYRPVEWERASHLSAEAFDGYFLGRPRIDRVTFRFIEDSRTALANVLAGAIDMAYQAVEFTESISVRDAWAASGEGTVWLQPNQLRVIVPQAKPDYARPTDLTVRDVRRALALAMNRPMIAEAANPGAALVVDSDGVPGTPLGDAIRSRAIHYDYLPAQAQVLLENAGWRRGGDGILEKDGMRFQLELLAERQAEQEGVYSVLRENYRQVGIELSFVELSSDLRQQATYPGLRHMGAFTNDLRFSLQNYQSSRIAAAETRWTGQNRSGFSSPLVDDAIQALGRSIRLEDRLTYAAETWRLITDEVASIPLYIRPVAYIVRKGIEGPIPASLSGSVTSNVQSWDTRL